MRDDPPIGRMTRSMLTLPWAMSLLGVQQMASLVAAPSRERIEAATGAFDTMRRATREPRGGWREESWKAANRLRRAVIDLARTRPSVDAISLAGLAADPRVAPLMAGLAGYIVPPLARLDSLRLASGDADALLREVANKLRIIRAVADAPARLRLATAGDEPLRQPLRRAAHLEPCERLWAVEAVGAWYADRAIGRAKSRDPEAVLTSEAAAGVPSWSLVMLHAGMGRALAGHVLRGLAPGSDPAVVRKAVTRFNRWCRRSSQRGYAGVAFESFGFAARLFHQDLVRPLDREIGQVDPGLLGYFWHGAGRAMYFAPANLLPSSNAPRTAIAHLDEETPHELAYQDALAGIAWETTLANLQDPDVMEACLRFHGAFADRAGAFSSGVSSAVVVRSLTAPEDASLAPFIEYEPCSGAVTAAAWRSLVALPCRTALDRWSRDPRGAGALEELFRYRASAA